ncbi:rhamnulokinase [Echinimonas agarilytica]|uniref:Rhamnulokinase n=1 Tax=Echinimonas agarilytica TaxID=1215918 RepID=A0AA42B8B6_9GAMM|nr:rhamnulokinase [Echinimonas agarilytica]MCM2680692.1 rhamnulokinase [Echinimonas agarilytica]
MKSVVAVDLGASSGRVMLGCLNEQKVTLEEYHRFKNDQVLRNGYSCWDLELILGEIKIGIDKVIKSGVKVCSLGIDTWGVDFVFLDANGNELGDYVSYRDNRTEGMLEKIMSDSGLSKEEIYFESGIQFLSFNTIFQLKAISEQKPQWFGDIDKLLFIPDYLNYKLSGVKHCEYTNASTSQLLKCQDKTWSPKLLEACGAKPAWFLTPELPSQLIGNYDHKGTVIPVCSVASHDTASAVAATPLQSKNTAFLSSGTWSLVGIESDVAFADEAAYEANLTNEGGVEGRYRVLKNIMGLWLIQRFKAENPSLEFSDIIQLASMAEPFKFIVDPNDGSFLNPKSMTQAIRNWLIERNMPAPETAAEIIRCIYDSLVLAYDDALHKISTASKVQIDELRIVGGGVQDKFLNQLCADVCQISVSAEPQEASAFGNVVNQFIALGDIKNIDEARRIINFSSNVNYFKTSEVEGLADIKSKYQKII